jgi:hypothetical protein
MFGRGHKLLNVPDRNLVSLTKLLNVPDTTFDRDKNKIEIFGSLASLISEICLGPRKERLSTNSTNAEQTMTPAVRSVAMATVHTNTPYMVSNSMELYYALHV